MFWFIGITVILMLAFFLDQTTSPTDLSPERG
jgi:hypothetical protein